jgi:uncharacterized protein
VERLDRGIVRVWTVVGLVVTAPLLVPGLLLLAAGAPSGLVVAAFVLWAVAAAVAAGVVPSWRYRHTGWRLVDGVLEVRRGALLRSHSAVPVFRIQHVDLQQGPLDRWAGVRSLTVHTAAPAADVVLPGLRDADAEALRGRLLELSRQAVVAHGAGPEAGTGDGV